MPDPSQQIRCCATPAGVRVAYATAGRGPALLVPAAWLSHLELAWQDPAVRAFYPRWRRTAWWCATTSRVAGCRTRGRAARRSRPT
jgi:hypothetical protein